MTEEVGWGKEAGIKRLRHLRELGRRGQCPSDSRMLNANYSGMRSLGCLMQTVINLMAGIRNTWFQMRTPFLGPSKSILFLPLACTDVYLVGRGRGRKAGRWSYYGSCQPH